MLRAVLNGELHLHYQPLVSLDRFELVGLEGLLRWQHREHGTLLPADFLAAAEARGLAAPIGRWVVRNACRHAAAWSATGTSVSVSLNVSPRHLMHGDLERTVARALEVSQLEPGQLTLEIPLRALASEHDVREEHLPALRSLGIGLSLDAVGAESPPCRDLARLGFTGLKLDRRLVAGLCVNSADTTFVAAAVNAAHSHGLRVTAVGVEREEQVATLRSLGCDAAQGYYFARPQPREVVDALVHHPFCWRETAPRHDVA
jgi:EAL domain-containing protein (putative c-di-GMP-specific phosphodiesterase class I)